MLASRSSSERIARHRRVARATTLLFALLSLAGAAGCRTVRPEDKEYLSEPSMTWTRGGFARAHEAHILENREGSTGGATTQGGGCGCN